jgi:hypothetical protein
MKSVETREQRMNINLHIERLILDGLPMEAGHGARVQAAVEAELARLLVEGGLARELQSGGALPSVRAGAIQLTAESNSVQLGQRIARSVYGGIGQSDGRQGDRVKR